MPVGAAAGKTEISLDTAAISKIGASERRTLLEDRSRSGNLATAAGLAISLAVVADGIGGENAGERAAEVTVSTVFEHCERSRETDIPKMLEAALLQANEKVHREARASRRKSNMGATAAVAVVHRNRLYVANVGDSRVYLVRGKQVTCLTQDHTWAREVVRSGKLRSEEAARHPRKDEIVRSIGYEATVDVDLGMWLKEGEEKETEARFSQGLPLKPGDLILVCSDGLIKTRHDLPSANYVERNEIASLTAGKAAQQAAEALVKKALSRGVDDNVSAAVLAMPGGGRRARPILPVVGLGAALVGLAALGMVIVPRLLGGSGSSQGAMPTIPALPSGVAYVSEVFGVAQAEIPGRGMVSLKIEDLVAAGQGVYLQSIGGGSYLRLGLADQSIVYLGPETRLQLLTIGQGTAENPTEVELASGILLVSTQGSAPGSFVVRAASGAWATLTGSVMGVAFDAVTGRFDVDCFHNGCEVVPGVAESYPMRLMAGEHVWVDGSGKISARDATRNELYSFAGYCGGLVPTPSGAPLAGGLTPFGPTRTPLGPIFTPPAVPPTEPPWQPPAGGGPAPTAVPPTSVPPTEPPPPPPTEPPPPPPPTEPPPHPTKEPKPTEEP